MDKLTSSVSTQMELFPQSSYLDFSGQIDEVLSDPYVKNISCNTEFPLWNLGEQMYSYLVMLDNIGVEVRGVYLKEKYQNSNGLFNISIDGLKSFARNNSFPGQGAYLDYIINGYNVCIEFINTKYIPYSDDSDVGEYYQNMVN